MNKEQVAFSAGYAEIYTVENVAEKGDKPVNKLINRRKVRFDYRTIGAVRFFMAKQANVEIDKTIIIPKGPHVSPQDIVILHSEKNEENEQYEIVQTQVKTDTAPHTILLTLKRRTEKYDFA